MAVQKTIDYKQHLRHKSGLPPQSLLIALVIADLRYSARLAAHEPLAMSLDKLAKECGIHRRVLIRWLPHCVESGWIVRRLVFRDGRQQDNEYLIADPTEVAQEPDYRVTPTSPSNGITEGRLRHSVPSDTPEREPSDVYGTPYYVVSTKEPSPTQPHAEAEVATQEGQVEVKGNGAPVPAQPQAAGPDAPETEGELLASMHSTRSYKGRDPSAISHQLVEPAPSEVLDELGVRRSRDPVLAVACPVKFCRARAWHKCKNPDHPKGHMQRIEAAAQAAGVPA